jgi:hypothetical protein
MCCYFYTQHLIIRFYNREELSSFSKLKKLFCDIRLFIQPFVTHLKYGYGKIQNFYDPDFTYMIKHLFRYETFNSQSTLIDNLQQIKSGISQ